VAELLHAQLTRFGLGDVNPNEVAPTIERYVSKREGQITTRTVAEVNDALVAATADVLDMDHDLDLSPQAERYADSLKPYVQQMYDKARDAVLKSGEYVPKADIPKLVRAEIDRRNADARKDKTNIQRADGAPAPTRDNSDMARVDRINSGTEDQADRDWWQTRFGRK
jgi:hypothetical protein